MREVVFLNILHFKPYFFILNIFSLSGEKFACCPCVLYMWVSSSGSSFLHFPKAHMLGLFVSFVTVCPCDGLVTWDGLSSTDNDWLMDTVITVYWSYSCFLLLLS